MRLRAMQVPTVVLVLALVTTACGGTDDPTVTGGEDEGGTITIAGQEANDHGRADVAGQGELELELDDSYFEPTVLEGEAGQQISLSLFNEGDNPHTFTIDDQDVDEELQPGQEGVTVDVTFAGSGVVLFYCRFHAGQGMRGGLSVGGSLEAATEDAGGGGSSEGTPSDDRY
ncbi:MAG: cupredoxin domain-containing protein [Actinomycetota bacterium]